MLNPAMSGFLKRSQNTRVSSATSRDGGGAVGITACTGPVVNPGSFALCHAKLYRASAAIRHISRIRPILALDTRRIACRDTMSPMNAFWNCFETLLGLGAEPKDLTFVQISLRAIIVFLVTLTTMRLGHKRSLSRKTPFDAVLLVILAAVLSRAINGSAAFFATLGGGVVLVVLPRITLLVHDKLHVVARGDRSSEKSAGFFR